MHLYNYYSALQFGSHKFPSFQHIFIIFIYYFFFQQICIFYSCDNIFASSSKFLFICSSFILADLQTTTFYFIEYSFFYFDVDLSSHGVIAVGHVLVVSIFLVLWVLVEFFIIE